MISLVRFTFLGAGLGGGQGGDCYVPPLRGQETDCTYPRHGPHKRPQKFSLHVLHRSRSASRSSATSAAPSPASSLDPLCPPRSRDRGLRSGCQTPGMDAAGSDADDKAKLSRFSNWKLTVGLAISKRWEWEEYATREAAWLMVITVIH